MEWVVLVVALLAAWLVVRLLNATDGPALRADARRPWWSRGETAKADARLGRNVIAAVATFLVVGSLLLNLIGYE
jgi:hypothetical protein